MNASSEQEQQPEQQVRMDATYDPADNKIRLRAAARLPKELYLRVKAAGFAWAPRQELFVAPAWSPEREDLALELCGEIGDEDTSLVERAEERAERFEDYQGKRAEDAERAHEAVSRIADNIPLGQPILVCHHSERHARRDAERIRSGMARAVKLWETSKYWEQRAKGALHHAKYKELPCVRHRRIKGLEADLRKRTKQRDEAQSFLGMWKKDGITRERALAVSNFDHLYVPGSDFLSVWGQLDSGKMTPEVAQEIGIQSNERVITYSERWIAHLTNRLAYERAMLDEGGGIAVKAQGFDVQPGGQVEARHGWAVVLRVNKTGGEVNSYTVAGRYGRMKVGIEEVKDYRPPSDEDAAKVKAATKLPPLVNYPGEGFRHMTKAEWDSRAKHSDFYRTSRIKATEQHGAYRQRMAPKGGGSYEDISVYVTDMPQKDRPAPGGEKPKLPEVLPREPRVSEMSEVEASELKEDMEAKEASFSVMKQSFKAGVQVVSADQLFPTPPALAERMVSLAGIGEGDRVLEPSAGTGNIVKAIRARGGIPYAVEINPKLASMVGAAVCADFLSLTSNDANYDAVVMNPPFKDAVDIAHILHAREFLKPGGRLVAICAGGPRQTEQLKPLAETWEPLPEGTFAGTGVHAVLLTIRRPA